VNPVAFLQRAPPPLRARSRNRIGWFPDCCVVCGNLGSRLHGERVTLPDAAKAAEMLDIMLLVTA